MAKFIINQDSKSGKTVEAEKYGFGDGFVNFVRDGKRVFSVNASKVDTIELID